MMLSRRLAFADRACAAIEDTRAIHLQLALDLSPAAAWMLAKMEADREGVDARDFPYDIILVNLPFFRQSDLITRLVEQIHTAIGPDSTLSDMGLIRLTPLGRLRIRTKLGEPVI